MVPEGAVLDWAALYLKEELGADLSRAALGFAFFSAAMALMRAGTVDAAITAGQGIVAPGLNLMLADRSGIALQTVGRIPARDPRHETQGRMPAPGWLAVNRWQGALPYEKNPREVNPASGLIGNTNNKTVDRPFPNHVSFDWGDTQRIQRWLTLMKTREVHTRESFIEAQLDTVSFTARSLLPLIGADLWFTGEAAPEGTPERLRQRALELLAAWNGEMNEHLPEPLIYQAWLRALQDRLIRDDLGPLADDPKTLRETARIRKAEQRELMRIAAQSALANGGTHLDAKSRALAKRRAAVKPLGRPLSDGSPARAHSGEVAP